MKAFPYGEGSDLVSKSNHLYVEHCMMFKHTTKDWRVVKEDDLYWIEADPKTEANDTLNHLASIAYSMSNPILNRKHYEDLEYKGIVDAIERTAKRTGTIIVSTSDTYDLLSSIGAKFNEDPPMTLNLSMSDDEFKELVEKTFPTWRDY
jgi:hypothetical protein